MNKLVDIVKKNKKIYFLSFLIVLVLLTGDLVLFSWDEFEWYHIPVLLFLSLLCGWMIGSLYLITRKVEVRNK